MKCQGFYLRFSNCGLEDFFWFIFIWLVMKSLLNNLKSCLQILCGSCSAEVCSLSLFPFFWNVSRLLSISSLSSTFEFSISVMILTCTHFQNYLNKADIYIYIFGKLTSYYIFKSKFIILAFDMHLVATVFVHPVASSYNVSWLLHLDLQTHKFKSNMNYLMSWNIFGCHLQRLQTAEPCTAG